MRPGRPLAVRTRSKPRAKRSRSHARARRPACRRRNSARCLRPRSPRSRRSGSSLGTCQIGRGPSRAQSGRDRTRGRGGRRADVETPQDAFDHDHLGAEGPDRASGRVRSDAVQAARKAVAIARAGAAAGVPTSKLRKMPSTTITSEPKVRIEPRDVSGEDKVAATMEVCRAQKRDEVANTNASYSDSDWTFELANTWGACLQWREVRVRIAAQSVAGEGDRREAAYDFRDGTTG